MVTSIVSIADPAYECGWFGTNPDGDRRVVRVMSYLMVVDSMKTSLSICRASLVLVWLGLSCGMALSQATCPSTPGRFAPSGGEVLDRYSGLVWQRCSLGQTWNGFDCTGSASTYTHEQAMIAAGQVGGGWRLPNIRELSSIADLGCYSSIFEGRGAAIDRTAFPRAPVGFVWSTTPVIRSGGGNVWSLISEYGEVESLGRHMSAYVRLVRSTP